MMKTEAGLGPYDEQLVQFGGLDTELGELHLKIESRGYDVEPQILDSLMALIGKVKEAEGNAEAGIDSPPDLNLEALEEEKDKILQALNNQEE